MRSSFLQPVLQTPNRFEMLRVFVIQRKKALDEADSFGYRLSARNQPGAELAGDIRSGTMRIQQTFFN